MRRPEAYTCTKCRHVSIWDGGTNGHTHHCDGTISANAASVPPSRWAASNRAMSSGSTVNDALNTERNALPGVSGTSSMGCSESGFWGTF